MNITFTDSCGIECAFPVPQEFGVLLKTQAVQHSVSTQQALLLGVASGRVVVTEATETVTSPAESFRNALVRLLSPEGQKAFLRKVYDDHNGGPICGAGEKPWNIRFSWIDGRYFEGVARDPACTVYHDDDGNVLTLEEIREGVSPYIKKGPPPDLGTPN